MNSRKPTMDMVTLIHDVIAAYIKKKRDNTLTQITIWDDDYDRNQVAEKYVKCLRNDEENEERGKEMSQEAKRIFGSNQSRVRAGSLDSCHLDLREIATHMLHPHEEAWVFNHPTSKKTTHVAAIQPNYSNQQSDGYQSNDLNQQSNGYQPNYSNTPV